MRDILMLTSCVACGATVAIVLAMLTVAHIADGVAREVIGDKKKQARDDAREAERRRSRP